MSVRPPNAQRDSLSDKSPSDKQREARSLSHPENGELFPVSQVGSYKILYRLGEGQMGSVWKVEHVTTGGVAAMKFVSDAGLSPERGAWFTSEVRILSSLTHPSIPRVHETGALADGTPWFVMDFIAGERLRDRFIGPPLSAEQRVRLFAELSQVVGYLHDQGIIHRDLTSSNILVSQSGRPYLLDFGVARQAENAEDPGFYADIYALAVILYEMMRGVPR